MFALIVKLDALLETIVGTLIFVFIGLIFFALAFGIIGKANAVFDSQGNRRRSKHRTWHCSRLGFNRHRHHHRRRNFRINLFEW